MTNKLIVSRSEIERIIEIANKSCGVSQGYKNKPETFIWQFDEEDLIKFAQSIIDKAEKSQVEPVAIISITDNDPWGYVYRIELNDKSDSYPDWNEWVINTFGGIGQYSLFTSSSSSSSSSSPAAADKQDAERYRWTRGKFLPDCCTPEELDEQIDTAMKGE